MTLKENLKNTTETYTVIYADSCRNTEKGSVSNRILAGVPFSRSGLTETEENILNLAQKGGRGLGEKRLSDWIASVQKCTTYDELARLDSKIQTTKNAHDIWKHCSSAHKGEKLNSCWEFDIGGYCRMLCYIDHKTKQVLVMHGTFTEADHASGNLFNRYSDLGDEIFERTNRTPIFEQIKQDMQLVNYAQIATHQIDQEKSDAYCFGEDSLSTYVTALKNLHKIEQEQGILHDEERGSIKKDLLESMELLYEEDKEAFKQLQQDIINTKEKQDERTNSPLKYISANDLNNIYTIMQQISTPAYISTQQKSY